MYITPKNNQAGAIPRGMKMRAAGMQGLGENSYGIPRGVSFSPNRFGNWGGPGSLFFVNTAGLQGLRFRT